MSLSPWDTKDQLVFFFFTKIRNAAKLADNIIIIISIPVLALSPVDAEDLDCAFTVGFEVAAAATAAEDFG